MNDAWIICILGLISKIFCFVVCPVGDLPSDEIVWLVPRLVQFVYATSNVYVQFLVIFAPNLAALRANASFGEWH
jgi:hypothetical protein